MKLVFIENNQALTTSKKVADYFEKNHRDILKAIRKLDADVRGVGKISQTPSTNKIEGVLKNEETPLFKESYYIHEQNRQRYPLFYMNRDGFMLLVMGLTGKKGLKKKVQFIEAFNKMKTKLAELLAEGKDAYWLETRQNGKVTRKAEVSVIKNFIAYARSQGYNGADKDFYSKFSIWANIISGLPMRKGRDGATVRQLNMVDLAENGIKNILINGTADGLHYSRITAQVEKWLDDFRRISFADSYVNNVPLIG